MKLSIVVPVYNVENYILDCLNSIYSQSCNSYEVIFIDDRGEDSSIEIIKNFIKEKNINNFKIVVQEKNSGLSEARNRGIDEAKGEYITFLDSDDLLEKKCLQNIIKKLEEYDVDLLELKVNEISETDINIKVETKPKNDTVIMTGENYFNEMCKNNSYLPMACGKIYKTNLLKEKNYFSAGLMFEDEEFLPRVLISAEKVKYVDLPFYIYRRRNGSITTNMMKNNKWLYSYLVIIDKLSNYAESLKNKETKNILLNRVAQFCLSVLKNPVAYGATDTQINEAIKIVKEKKLYKIPQERRNLFIKLQGYCMKNPDFFIKIYSKMIGVKR